MPIFDKHKDECARILRKFFFKFSQYFYIFDQHCVKNVPRGVYYCMTDHHNCNITIHQKNIQTHTQRQSLTKMTSVCLFRMAHKNLEFNLFFFTGTGILLKKIHTKKSFKFFLIKNVKNKLFVVFFKIYI